MTSEAEPSRPRLQVAQKLWLLATALLITTFLLQLRLTFAQYPVLALAITTVEIVAQLVVCVGLMRSLARQPAQHPTFQAIAAGSVALAAITALAISLVVSF